MMPALRSEIRKLLTARPTYYLSGLAILIVGFVGFYIEGYKLTGGDLQNHALLASDTTDALSAIMTIGVIVGVLLMTYEYRFNTIVYTLTASNNRSKVLLAKILTVTGYAILFSLVVGSLSPLMTYLGVHLHGNHLVPQTINYSDLLWRSVYYGWSYSMIGLLIATIIRNQVGAIVSLFLIPTIELLFSQLLKGNSVYLPFTALGSLVRQPDRYQITHARAAQVVGIYLIVGWIVAWLLFLRRDAS